MIKIIMIMSTALFASDYHVDIYDIKGKKNEIEIVFEYKGCIKKIITNKDLDVDAVGDILVRERQRIDKEKKCN